MKAYILSYLDGILIHMVLHILKITILRLTTLLMTLKKILNHVQGSILGMKLEGIITKNVEWIFNHITMT